jgi:hypothetical protein
VGEPATISKYRIPLSVLSLFLASVLVVYISLELLQGKWTWSGGWLPVFVVLGFLALSAVRAMWLEMSAQERDVNRRVAAAEARFAKEPEKAAPAWTVAQARMEQFFGRNLLQANLIFVVSLVVMAVGFGFVVYGIKLGLSNPAALSTSYLAGAFGALSEFIGVTFLVVYRSTLTEANSFMSVLERINTVGMAVQILDSIPDADAALKNQVRAELVQLLVRGAGKTSVPAPKRKGVAAGDSEA